jgi:hypothetical protein
MRFVVQNYAPSRARGVRQQQVHGNNSNNYFVQQLQRHVRGNNSNDIVATTPRKILLQCRQ